MSMGTRVRILRMGGYKIGKECLIGSNFKITDRSTDKDNIFIGDRVNIGSNVTLVTTSWPNTSKLNRIYSTRFARISVENDCWIGTGAIILPGVTIGKCSIVGAGVVVDRDIQPFTAVKHAGYESIRLHEKLIEKLTND